MQWYPAHFSGFSFSDVEQIKLAVEVLECHCPGLCVEQLPGSKKIFVENKKVHNYSPTLFARSPTLRENENLAAILNGCILSSTAMPHAEAWIET